MIDKKVEANLLIDKFYNKTKDEHRLSREQIHDICRTPFKLIHMVIEDMNNDIPIRIMNLGTFKRDKKRVGIMMKSNGISDEDKKLLQEAYTRL
jgi:ethanolamine utilization protein EutA (predicted chaperonin)